MKNHDKILIQDLFTTIDIYTVSSSFAALEKSAVLPLRMILGGLKGVTTRC